MSKDSKEDGTSGGRSKYLPGIDIDNLSKAERRKLTRKAKRDASGKAVVPVKKTMTKEDRREKYTNIEIKKREKQRKKEEKRWAEGRGVSRNKEDEDAKSKNLRCIGCRGKGHLIKDCKKSKPNTTGMCFNCGSTEHTLGTCRERKQKGGVLPFAECFVCGEKGHLSGQCSKNENGIYPKGGCCKICESVHHLACNCPELGTSKDKHAQGGDLDVDTVDKQSNVIATSEDAEHKKDGTSTSSGKRKKGQSSSHRSGGDDMDDIQLEVEIPTAVVQVVVPSAKKAKKSPKVVKF